MATFERKNHPGIAQIGSIVDDGKTVTVSGWALSGCLRSCSCHIDWNRSASIILQEDKLRGELGLQQFYTCDCCVPWTFVELRDFVRELHAIQTLTTLEGQST